MKTEILFQEAQKQNMKWIWFLLIILICLVLFGAIQQIIFKKPFGTHPVPDWGFAVFLSIPLFFFIVLIRTELQTKISPDTISIRYRPFFNKEKVYNWEDIEHCYVRLYSPVKEYGGWGVRTAFNGKNGKAYNVSGTTGIQLELKNGEKILIGTQKAKEAEEIINRFKKA